MEIQILSVTIEKVPTAKGSYEKAAVAFKDDKGKVTGKNIVSFVYPKVWEAISKAQGGERYNVTNEKVGDNWNWTAIEKLAEGQSAPKSTASTTAPLVKNTYETPEERAKKQVYIVRQSSISNAIDYATGVKAVKSIDELLAIAKKFEDYVFADEPLGAPLEDIPVDEPN